MKKCDKVMKCMCDVKKDTIKFLESDWDTKEKSMVVIIAMLLGIIIGFMISPVKKGFFSGNKVNCDNTAIDTDGEDFDEAFCEDDFED